MALPQRLLFTSVVHMACCDMHNRSGAAPVLQGWKGSNFLLRRWKFDLRGSTSEVFSLHAFVVSPSSTSFHSSCQFLLHFRGHLRSLSYHISLGPANHPLMLDFQPDSLQKGHHTTSTRTSSHWLLLSL